MELIEEHDFPCSFEICLGVRLRIARVVGAEEFGITKKELAFAVIGFARGLTGVCAAVEFEIEFAGPGEEVSGFFNRGFVEIAGTRF